MVFIVISSIFIEFITIGESHFIDQKSLAKTICIWGKKGFKVDYDVATKFMQNELIKRKNWPITIKMLNNVCLFLPGVNLFWAMLKSWCLQRKYRKDKQIMATLVPMNWEENAKFKNAKRFCQKAGFATYISLKTAAAIELKYAALPMKYTLEEVRRLNQVNHGNFKIGTINNINVAIIGIPSLEDVGNKFIINNKEVFLEQLPRKYEDSFVVYPFAADYKQDNGLQTCMDCLQIYKNTHGPLSESHVKTRTRQRVKFIKS